MLRCSLVFAVCLLITGCKSGPAPGEEAFDKANTKISAYNDQSKQVGWGNSEDAEELATRLSLAMERFQKVMFAGAGQGQGGGLTGGRFLTYCELHEDKICFLVHVPQMNNYQDDIRDALIEMAWKSATSITIDYPKDRVVAVGLRGTLVYGGMAVGTPDGKPETENSAVVSKTNFYKFFDDEPKVASAFKPNNAAQPR